MVIQARPIDSEHNALDILFVRLTSLPNPIQLDGLPLNVIPLTYETIRIKCELPNRSLAEIACDQVPVVLNSAMTDFASQGRTRKYNVCDLQNCKNH